MSTSDQSSLLLDRSIQRFLNGLSKLAAQLPPIKLVPGDVNRLGGYLDQGSLLLVEDLACAYRARPELFSNGAARAAALDQGLREAALWDPLITRLEQLSLWARECRVQQQGQLVKGALDDLWRLGAEDGLFAHQISEADWRDPQWLAENLLPWLVRQSLLGPARRRRAQRLRRYAAGTKSPGSGRGSGRQRPTRRPRGRPGGVLEELLRRRPG